MINDDVYAVLSQSITWEQPLELLYLSGEGSYFQLLVVSHLFEKVSLIEKLRKVSEHLRFHVSKSHILALATKAVALPQLRCIGQRA